MKRSVVIRADGGTSIGMGHIVRCLALADMIRDHFHVIFAIQAPSRNTLRLLHPVTGTVIHLPETSDYQKDAENFSDFLRGDEIVVLDGYHFETNYQKRIKEKGNPLVVIDDLHAWHQVADVIINHADGVQPSDYSKEDHTRLCLGFPYVLLRKEFLSERTAEKKLSAVKKAFISMGAADINNITSKCMQALLRIKGIEEIHLMLGTINPHLDELKQVIQENAEVKIISHFDISAQELKELLSDCDIAICPASSISLESCATGIALLSGYTAENQLSILDGLLKHKAAVNLGHLNQIGQEELTAKISELISRPDTLNQLLKQQAELIDGKSPERILKVFRQLSPQKLTFRMATESDADLYFEWANEESVRKNSFNQDLVAYEEHIKWFKTKLSSGSCAFYLFLDEQGQPAGQVRIDFSKEETLIGISVAPAFRGQSLAPRMLEDACGHFHREHPQRRVTAYIKTDNLPSYAAFKKAGFIDEGIVKMQGHESYKLYKKATT